MSNFLLSYGVASYVAENVLIVLFQADFYVEVTEALQQDLLKQLHTMPTLQGLIIDVSRVKLMDLHNMHTLENILNMTALLGVTGFLVGVQPVVTATLIELGYDPTHLNTARTVEQAILLMHQRTHIGKDSELIDFISNESGDLCDDSVKHSQSGE